MAKPRTTGARASGAKTSGTKTAGAKAPGAGTAGAKTAGAKTPGTKTAGAGTAGARTPDVTAPVVAAPAARSPWARQRGTAGAGTAADGDGLPRQLKVAVWLMYAGAVISAVDLIATLATSGSAKAEFRAAHPAWTAARVSQTAEQAIFATTVVWLLTVGLWVIMARTNLAGRQWARIAATVLCVLSTVSFFLFLVEPSSLISKVLLPPEWAVGLVAAVLLWQPKVGRFVKAREAAARVTRDGRAARA